ncbi:MAG: hypothetical protein KME06_17735 [Kastovskya adunca ATA6-11-RM4]|jgi:hypothetical protein|nr:hypothetical protein [Kastovskya adunca ATA6-11-RM4]
MPPVIGLFSGFANRQAINYLYSGSCSECLGNIASSEGSYTSPANSSQGRKVLLQLGWCHVAMSKQLNQIS